LHESDISPPRDKDSLAVHVGEPTISTDTVDLTDEDSIAALGDHLASIDQVVSTASARARLWHAVPLLPFDQRSLAPPIGGISQW
jgi:hypothetical protein